MGHFGKSMVKLDVLTHETNNSGHIIKNNVINCQCLIGPCYSVPAKGLVTNYGEGGLQNGRGGT